MKLFSILIASVILICSVEIYAQNKSGAKLKDNINDIVVEDINGNKVKLSDFHGKVLLIVNTASECGSTPQYGDLQKLYDKYNAEGFEILAFPSNDFGNQEPLNNEEIKEFCSNNYGVTFKLFDKIKILGEDKSSLYQRLTNNSVTDQSDIKWNFEKFLISKDGRIVKRIPTKVKPLDENVIAMVEKELAK